MKRKLLAKLLEWKETLKPDPILLTGAKGVGKTYFVCDFAKSYYKEYVYINFETEPFLYNQLFKMNPSMIGNSLKNYFQLSDSTEPVLLILDEISEKQDVALILNGLATSGIHFHIIFISSLLSIKVPKNMSFYHLTLFPLDFEEFLIATGNEWYIEVIKTHFSSNEKIPDIVHKELLTLFQLYLDIGGMPLAVNEYINTEALFNVSEQHRILLNSFTADAYKRNTEGNFLKICQAFRTIDSQLSKENRKFQYKLIRKGATQAQYWKAIQYICDSGYGMCCYKFQEETKNKSAWPICPYDDIKNEKSHDNNHFSFKLYMWDTGVLSTVLKTNLGQFNETIKKGVLENYVAQSLFSNSYPLMFWESASLAKLDFIIWKEDKILPIEIKINDNTRSRNVSIFKTHYSNITESIKISTRNFGYSNQVKYVPYYAVFCI